MKYNTKQQEAFNSAKKYYSKNKTIKGFECPICNNNRYYIFEKDNETMCCDCGCSFFIGTINKAKENNLTYFDKTFEDYETDNALNKQIKARAKAYIKDISSEENQWWFIGGHTGTGKTLITSIICNELFATRNDIKRINWENFVNDYKSLIRGDNESIIEANRMIKECQKVSILFIDEAFRTPTEADRKAMYNIVNYRYDNKLPTLITSEHTIDEFGKIDPSLRGRIFELSKGYCFNVNSLKDHRIEG